MGYYLYRHIREDEEIPFYVGLAKHKRNPKSFNDEYYRAFLRSKRTAFWKNIVNKTTYRVEVVYECDSIEEIKRKEIEFISLYGRRDIGKGSLVNLTNGGEGNKGYIWTEEGKEKLRKPRVNIFLPITAKKIFRYNAFTGKFIKEYPSYATVSRELNINKSIFSKLKGSYAHGSLWFTNYKGEIVDLYIGKVRKSRLR